MHVGERRTRRLAGHQRHYQELTRIQSLGLKTEVIWPNILNESRLTIEVNPDDPNAGRGFGYFFTY